MCPLVIGGTSAVVQDFCAPRVLTRALGIIHGRILNDCPKDFERGRDTRFGTKRCAFGDKPYGVAESYSRKGVNVEVNSSRSPE
ncbi:hypothetical protein PIB30_097671 [Stylosanthes scabra]|uniref:Uncharacterized protein n=1 Tax=Stylosanthes scabra TaxID=79078 RepID=A0ABU6SWU8_9FABA|nr:hypothetical protein [Stylosanthes scabra]